MGEGMNYLAVAKRVNRASTHPTAVLLSWALSGLKTPIQTVAMSISRILTVAIMSISGILTVATMSVPRILTVAIMSNWVVHKSGAQEYESGARARDYVSGARDYLSGARE